MTREEAIANLKMIGVAFVEPITKEQGKLIDDTFDMAIKALEQEPCEDCISRQAVVDALSHMCSEDENEITVSRANVCAMLKYLPSAQTERKKGKWITNLYAFGEDRYECNRCHNTAFHCYDYCPNCGADMRGDENGKMV